MRDFALDVWEDLRAKRLWPVAVVLAVALVAVPVFLLKGEPEERHGAPTPKPSAAQLPIVNPDSTAMGGTSALDAFSEKDPFEPLFDRPDLSDSLMASTSIDASGDASAADLGSSSDPMGGGAGADDQGGASAGDSGAGGSPGSSGGGSPGAAAAGGGGGSGSAPPSGGGGGTPTPEVRFYAFSVDVMFGLLGNERRYSDMRAVTPLTGRGGRVVVVYLGQNEAGDAVFLVNQDFEVTKGAEHCRQACAFVYLRPEGGRDEVHLRYRADGAIYRLELLSVRRVLDDRQVSGQSSSGDRRAGAAAREHGRARARRLTPFDFRIPLIAGRRR